MEPPPTDARAWDEARRLFLDIVELEPEPRRAELARLRVRDPGLCAFVERLLAADAGPDEGGEGTPRRFGPYEEVRLLGAGGMGEVVVARRVDGEFEREVAVKLMRPGHASEELVARFLRERQTLAQLDHEYVARLLDGGTTEQGEPYLVMEYVEGVPVDEFARELELPERLRLFLRVCSAVQHAHERGVIHRDLKPNNILVRPDGTPRLLDFGIARPRDDAATPGGPLTRTGHRLFTPEYASPEQVRGEAVTEAADVFALGVLLYQLLCGERPWRSTGGLHALEREILELDPAPPSRRLTGTARRSIAGDLDTIALKCLSNAPARRYSAVEDLARDLERHLAGYPIEARRTGVVQRAWRFGRRKPWTLVGVTALVAATLATAIALQTSRANERRRRELVASVEDRIESARTLREQGHLDEAVEELESALGALEGLPAERFLRANVFGQLAVAANHQRRFEDTLSWVDEASALVPEQDPRSVRLRASLLGSRAYALSVLGPEEASWQAAVEALDYCRSALPPGDELTVDNLLGVADLLRARGDVDAALERLEQAVAETRKADDPYEAGLGSTLNLWGLTLEDAGRHEEAAEKLLEALEVLSWHFPEGHPSIAQVRENAGVSLLRLGRLDEAQEQHARALAIRRKLGLEVPVAKSLTFLGKVAFDRGDHELARDRWQEALDIRERLLEPDDRLVARSRYWLGLALDETGDTAAARAALEGALDPRIEPGALEESMQATARFLVGRILVQAGERDAGRAQLERALALQRRLFGEADERTARTRALLED